MKIIFDYYRTIFNPDNNKLYNGVFDLLNDLSLTNELFLVSSNEPERKIMLKDFGIDHFFKEKFFVDKKSVELFKQIGKEEEKVFVVGDMVSNEIKIGNLLGYFTIWVKQGKFANLLPVGSLEKPKYIVKEINLIREIIKKHE